MLSRKQQVLGNLRQASQTWPLEERQFAQLMAAQLPRTSRPQMATAIARLLRWRLPHRMARDDIGQSRVQLLRNPIAALHAGGDCDDYAYCAGLLWRFFYPSDALYLAWFPDAAMPYHVALAVDLNPSEPQHPSFVAIDPLPPYPLTYSVDVDKLTPWPA